MEGLLGEPGASRRIAAAVQRLRDDGRHRGPASGVPPAQSLLHGLQAALEQVPQQVHRLHLRTQDSSSSGFHAYTRQGLCAGHLHVFKRGWPADDQDVLAATGMTCHTRFRALELPAEGRK